MRWGEVIALRPRHIDFLRRMVSVEDTIVETSKKNPPTGERFIVKRYPKNNEPRTFGVRQAWLDEVRRIFALNRSLETICCLPRGSAPRSLATPSAPRSGSRR
jgi:integrase